MNSQTPKLLYSTPELKVFRPEYILSLSQTAKAMIEALTLERERLTEALQDALCFHDRATGAVRGDGWTAAETLRLAEIRAIAYGVEQKSPDRPARAAKNEGAFGMKESPAQMPRAANRVPADAQIPPASHVPLSGERKPPENGS
jgi:hypothetical protein